MVSTRQFQLNPTIRAGPLFAALGHAKVPKDMVKETVLHHYNHNGLKLIKISMDLLPAAGQRPNS
jgi:hypothetical protein